MKQTLIGILFVVLASGAEAQTRNNPLGVTVGGGSQKYSGDLGNGIKFKNEVWRGGAGLNANYYLSRSFDGGAYGYIGDFGYCQPHDKINRAVDAGDRCPGCLGRLGLGNLSSRMYIAGAQLRYKFANGYILPESARIQPYVSIGIAVNRLQDRMKMNCVETGNYGSANAGAGFRYYFTERLNIGYNANLGFFLSDGLDFINRGGNDMFLQQSVMLGIDLL
jgi:hypothetical protein